MPLKPKGLDLPVIGHLPTLWKQQSSMARLGCFYPGEFRRHTTSPKLQWFGGETLKIDQSSDLKIEAIYVLHSAGFMSKNVFWNSTSTTFLPDLPDCGSVRYYEIAYHDSTQPRRWPVRAFVASVPWSLNILEILRITRRFTEKNSGWNWRWEVGGWNKVENRMTSGQIPRWWMDGLAG